MSTEYIYQDFNNISILCSVINTYYQKLADLTINGCEDSVEYDEVLDNLRDKIELEKKELKKLDLKTIRSFFDNYYTDEDNPIDNRRFSRLSEREKVLCGEPKLDDDSLLSNVIESKILIDMFKLVYKKILTQEDKMSEEDFISTMMYYNFSKFTYLTENTFIEKIALAHNFHVDELPELSFDEIEKAFNIPLKKNLMEILRRNIFTELEALSEICEDDKVLSNYLKTTELARIQVMLKYLDERTFNDVFYSYMALYGESKSDMMKQAKKLIKKRKKDFN